MGLQIQERKVHDVIVLDLDGRVVAGAEVVSLREKLDGLLSAGDKYVLLNFGKVAYVDSTGLGHLVSSHTAFQHAGGAMKLAHLSKRHIELLVLTKLSTVFEIFDTEEAALNSFPVGKDGVRHFDILEFVKSQEEEPQNLESEETARE
jgi:anti-sigma B factor antagonist